MIEVQGRGGIAVKVIEDSVNDDGWRLTTLQLRYPRFIHAEFLTHRVFSRNASSSRAIPVAKMIEQVRNDPALPIHWGRNQAGMQAYSELDDQDRVRAHAVWRSASLAAAHFAEQLSDIGAHKQICNRLLEPFQFMNVVVTATEWRNFFALRRHHTAEPTIQELANRMYEAMKQSTPKLLADGEWHLPYITRDERNDSHFQSRMTMLARVSVARCARVSYNKHDGTRPGIREDLALCDRLINTDLDPMHASPAEHQATPDCGHENWYLHGNLVGWQQFRKLIEAGRIPRSANPNELDDNP